MFCKNCNEEIHGDMKNCPKCGCQIENGIEGNYVFFPKIKGEKRETVNMLFRIIHMAVLCFAAIMVIRHIYGEIQAAEHYKILLYVMRFICMCGFYLVLEFIADEIKWMMLLERNPAVGLYSSGKVLIAEMVYIFLGVIGGIMLISPSEVQELEMLAAVADDSFLDYMIAMKLPLILLILAAVIKSVLVKKVGSE
ncbi:MAG: hypothetical protein HFH38_12290 [Lachnospiraceae bacterium]|jgi:hypothetical protein|nr:hypothetical protein [Lachnospiraceae bacterium]